MAPGRVGGDCLPLNGVPTMTIDLQSLPLPQVSHKTTNCEPVSAVDPKDSSAYEVMSRLVSSLVDQPEIVRIIPTPAPEGVCFSITVHSTDMGKLIGKQGRTARSLRVILSVIGAKMRRRYSLDIVSMTILTR
jgi:predicted RNA-binding protein YlqC (UPF0109 family)